MEVKIKISIGELVDKITILEIKREMIGDKSKQKNVIHELEHLEDKLNEVISEKEAELKKLTEKLKKVNKQLWIIEDEIRRLENLKNFEDEFIKLARSVYITNDKRFELKNEINELFSSEVKEVKSYEKY